MRPRSSSLLLAAAACACASSRKPLPDLPPVPASTPAQIFQFSDKAKSTRLDAFSWEVPPDHVYGQASWGVGVCDHRNPLTNARDHFHFAVSDFADVFADIMKRHGYPVEDGVELFPNSNPRVADLRIGARVVDAVVNECYPTVGEDRLLMIGDAYLKIEWSIFSNLDKKIIYTTATEGTTYRELESEDGQRGVLRVAFADALERLAVDPGYRQAIDPATERAER